MTQMDVISVKTRYLMLIILGGILSVIGAYLLSPAIAWLFGAYLVFFLTFEIYTRLFHAVPNLIHHELQVPDGYPHRKE
jgi:4-hydroxybenzoate polyprenyltransferase